MVTEGEGLLPALDRVLASGGDWQAGPEERIEQIRLTAAEAARPYRRLATSAGREVLLALERGQVLRDGDLLYRGNGLLLVAAIDYPPVVEITLPPWSGERLLVAALRLAHFIGNQHFPLRVLPDGRMRVPVEHPASLVELLQRGPVPEAECRIREGEAGDPLPNPHAHHHA